MKEFVHNQFDTSICIYENNRETIRGSFFKDKPKVGYIIMSHVKRDVSFLYVFEILAVEENRDARINSRCSYDPKKTYFELKVRDVTDDKKFSHIDNSMDRINFNG